MWEITVCQMYARENKPSNCTTNELLPFVLMTELYRGLTFNSYNLLWLLILIGHWGLESF